MAVLENWGTLDPKSAVAHWVKRLRSQKKSFPCCSCTGEQVFITTAQLHPSFTSKFTFIKRIQGYILSINDFLLCAYWNYRCCWKQDCSPICCLPKGETLLMWTALWPHAWTCGVAAVIIVMFIMREIRKQFKLTITKYSQTQRSCLWAGLCLSDRCTLNTKFSCMLFILKFTNSDDQHWQWTPSSASDVTHACHSVN